MTASVTLKELNHWFGKFQALKNIELDIDAGEYVTLLGPSGCGKTTLLSILGGFILPSQGNVLINGKDMTRVSPAKRPTTTMFQDYALFPHMSLIDNVAFGLRMAGKGRTERAGRARKMLDLVALGSDATKRPHELSGGQRQRVALARALAVDPEVLLLDEPLGALDLKLRKSMQDELKDIQREIGTTFIHVTHDQEEAMAIADRIVVMNSGSIEDHGPPSKIYCNPATLFAADFMGEMNHIPTKVTNAGLETPFGTLSNDGEIKTGEVVVCVRPESLGPKSGEFSIGPATVRDSAFFGTHFRIHVVPEAATDLTLVSHLPLDAQPQIGDRLELYAKSSDLKIYPKET